eukprot:Phypoly_transcript_05692.p1 GENE.Phypoly_transcript_05692~~Phypoly_transcript_05692.p1  ORF type:complete len:592 (+),score=94.86 Phypoly_transcript_05692:87-1862(+)
MKVVRIGCGAGFQGDRVVPAVQLLKEGKLDYLVLECLAERTLADSIERMKSGGQGYDTRLKEWLTALLPLATQQGVRIITNMGAADPVGGGAAAAQIAQGMGISIKVGVISEVEPGPNEPVGVGCTYLGAEPIVEALTNGADLVIAGRVADPSLFVAPIAYSFGWDLTKDFHLIAQATMAGHLLECGCHLTGGYFMHPMGRNTTFESLANLSLPFCDITSDGKVTLGKLEGSGGELSHRTCKQQLTYEIGDPTAYITPDVIVDFSKIVFKELTPNAVEASGATATTRPETLLRLIAKPAGVKAWGEVAFGGLGCVERASWAAQLVHKWMEDRKPGVMKKCMTYMLGYNSLYFTPPDPLQNPASVSPYPPEARVRFDGLFDNLADAGNLVLDLGGLGLAGPAGAGGYTYGIKPDVSITKVLIPRKAVRYELKMLGDAHAHAQRASDAKGDVVTFNGHVVSYKKPENWVPLTFPAPAPSGRVLMYDVAHARSGDKGDTCNVGLIPYNPSDLSRIQQVVTKEWVENLFRPLLTGDKYEINIYTLHGISALNITISPALDGGVSVSRRIDRHGKTLSDLILNVYVDFPPELKASL